MAYNVRLAWGWGLFFDSMNRHDGPDVIYHKTRCVTGKLQSLWGLGTEVALRQYDPDDTDSRKWRFDKFPFPPMHTRFVFRWGVLRSLMQVNNSFNSDLCSGLLVCPLDLCQQMSNITPPHLLRGSVRFIPLSTCDSINFWERLVDVPRLSIGLNWPSQKSEHFLWCNINGKSAKAPILNIRIGPRENLLRSSRGALVFRHFAVRCDRRLLIY